MIEEKISMIAYLFAQEKFVFADIPQEKFVKTLPVDVHRQCLLLRPVS